MIIMWHGQACFSLQSSSQKVVLDPYSEDSGLRTPSLKGDIVCVSHNHPENNNINAVSGDPFIVGGVGEYERQGVRIRGISSYHDNQEGKERGLNTLYRIIIDNITFLHMGDIGQAELTDTQVDQIGSIDILMIPVGGTDTIDGRDAISIIHQIQPIMVIPMRYNIPSLKAELKEVDEFLGEIGAKDVEPQDKLTIRKRIVAQEDAPAEVVLLKPSV